MTHNSRMDPARGRDPTAEDRQTIFEVKAAYASVMAALQELPPSDALRLAEERLTESCMWATRAVFEGSP